MTLTPQSSTEASQLAAKRIAAYIYATPLIPSATYGGKLLFKAENFQRTGAFKIRGASNKLSALKEQYGANCPRVVTASSGNHGLGCAIAAKELGVDLTIVLPENASALKLERIREACNNTILIGTDTDAAEAHAQQMANEQDYIYISPYNDPDIIAGQGTIGLELVSAMESAHIDHIFISMGGGGLISGISSVVKTLSPTTKIWGVSAANSAEFEASLKAGKTVSVEHKATLADGVAGGIDSNTITLPLALPLIDNTLSCSESEIKEAFRNLALEEGMIVEGSAALALAGYKQVAAKLEGQTSVIVLCGGNIDKEKSLKLLCNA